MNRLIARFLTFVLILTQPALTMSQACAAEVPTRENVSVQLAPDASETSETSEGYLFMLKENALMQMESTEANAGVVELDEDLMIYQADSLADVFDFVEFGNIAYLERDIVVELQDVLVPNDPLYASHQMDELSVTRMTEAWGSGLDGNGVTLAVIDSGLIPSHEDLDGAHILPGAGFIPGLASTDTLDETGHGTFITGLIAAQMNNSVGIAGATDGVDIMPLKCFNDTTTSLSYIINAIDYAVEHDADILNMSFGTDTSSSIFEAAISNAISAGVIIVASVGNNSGTDLTKYNRLMYPAAYPNVIGTGSVNAAGDLAPFSRINASVDVVAPGQSLASLSYLGPNRYNLSGSGTSYSAPYVAAMAALAMQADPDLTPAEFESLLSATAIDKSDAGYDISYGWGIADNAAFMAALPEIHTLTLELNGGVFPSTVGIPSVFTKNSKSIALPEPERDEHVFAGWFTSKDLSGTQMTELAQGTGEDVVLYAKWILQPSADAGISGIAVLGHAGTLVSATDGPDAVSTFAVQLPAGTTTAAITVTDVIITPASASATLTEPLSVDGGISWTATVTSGNGLHQRGCLILNEVLDDPTPQLAITDMPTGVATPASIDGRQDVTPFSVDMSGWFTDTDEYGNDTTSALMFRLLSASGSGTAVINGNSLEYIPSQADAGPDGAGGTITLTITASDEWTACPDPAVLELTIAPLPASRSTINPDTAEYDRNEASVLHENIAVATRLHGNRLQRVTCDDVTLSAGSDYEETDLVVLSTPYPDAANPDIVLLTPTSSRITLKSSWLSGLANGSHVIRFLFTAGADATLTLTVLNTATEPDDEDDSTTTPTPAPTATPTDAPTPAPTATPTDAPTPAPTATPVDDQSGSNSKTTVSRTSAGASIGTLLEIPNGGVPLAVPVFMDGSLLIPSIDAASLEALLTEAEATRSLVLDFSAASSVTSIRFSDDDFRNLADSFATAAAIETLRLVLPGFAMEFDRSAMASILAQMTGADLTITITPVSASELTKDQLEVVGTRPVFAINISSSGKALTHFEGRLAFSLPYALRSGEHAAGIVVRLVAADGTTEATDGLLFPFDSSVRFSTNHLSLSMIDYDAELAWTNPFQDMKATDWFYHAVRYANMNGLFNGTSAGRFSPESPMTRAMFVTVLSRLDARHTGTATGVFFSTNPSGTQSEFDDVPNTGWYADAVTWATREGITDGIGYGRFGPDISVTREQIATMLYSHANHLDILQTTDAALTAEVDTSDGTLPGGFSLNDYPDSLAVSDWADEAVAWAVQIGLLQGGSDDRLTPGGIATRAQVAVILQRYSVWLDGKQPEVIVRLSD